MAMAISRRLHEAVTIGDSLVTIVGIERSVVRLAIEAPADVEIHRGDGRYPPDVDPGESILKALARLESICARQKRIRYQTILKMAAAEIAAAMPD